MIVETSTVKSFRIQNAERLDPILVILQDIQPGKGRLIVECYGDAWSGYWNAIGDRNIAQFIASCEADYIAGAMLGAHHSRSKNSQQYLLRIVKAVQEALHSME